MADNFIPIDERTFQRVFLVQKVVYVISFVTFLQISLFPTDISILGSPNILKNDIFNLDTFLGRKVTLTEKLLFNFMLYLPFMIQHLTMSRMWFKKAVERHWRNYVFYERFVFNFASSISCLFMYVLHQPDERVIFNVDFPFASIIWYLLYAFGFFMSSWAAVDMGENDLHGFGLLKEFKAKKGSKFPACVDVKTNSILRASCRHPLYFSMFIYNTFGPTVYTATRLGHIITIVVFVYIGAKLEERGLKSLPGYTEYMKATPNQFIPDVTVWFKGVKTA